MAKKFYVTLTADLAHCAGEDAANRQMRKAARTRWSDEDWNTFVTTTNRLLMDVPLEQGGLQGIPEDELKTRGLI